MSAMAAEPIDTNPLSHKGLKIMLQYIRPRSAGEEDLAFEQVFWNPEWNPEWNDINAIELSTGPLHISLGQPLLGLIRVRTRDLLQMHIWLHLLSGGQRLVPKVRQRFVCLS